MKIGDICPKCGKGQMYQGGWGSETNENDTKTAGDSEFVCDAKECGYRQKAVSRGQIENVPAGSDDVTATKANEEPKE